MKQLFIIFAICYCFVLPATSQSKKEISAAKAKTLTEWNTKTKDGNSMAYKSLYEEYDRKGNTTLKVEYEEDGSLIRKETSEFDKFDRLVAEILYDGEKKSTVKKTYKYDAFDNKTEEAEVGADNKLIRKTTFSYNKDGNKTFETTSDANGKVLKKTTFTYNAKKLKATKTTVNNQKDSETTRKWEYTHY